METLLRIGLSNAVAALLLALLVVTVACVWRRPAVLHALWLLVLVKLVTPPLVWLPEPWAVAADAAPASGGRQPPPLPALPPLVGEGGGGGNPGADAPRLPAAADALPPLADGPAADPAQWEAVLVSAPDVEAAPPPAPAPAPVAPPPAAPWWAAAVFGLWLAGALGWYALALVRLRRFRRLLRHAVPAPESLRQRTQRLAEKMRLRRRPAVWLVPGRVAPMLWAAGGSPCILFPSDLLGQTTTEQQNALLVHELAHLRRRDHWVRWLEFAASGLYWWNPVLWFARRELREAEEQCCDAWVTSTLPGAGKTYAVALLETLDFLSDAPRATPMLASGVGRVADLKRRLTMIMSGTTPRALSWRGLLAVLGLGALLLPLLPAWARAQPPAKADAPDKPEVRTLRFIDADATGREDLQMAKAELQELEAQLAKKQAETADLAAKVAALRMKLAAADGQPRRIVVSVDGQNVRYADVLKLIQTAQPGGENAKVIVVDGATGKIIMTTNGPIPTPPPPPAAVSADKEYFLRWTVVPKNGPIFAVPPGAVVPAPPADADKRIDELEIKLKRILDEVEQLRKERKPGDAPPLHSYGPTPLEKLPVIGGLYVKPVAGDEPATALVRDRDAVQVRVLALLADAEAEQAQAGLNVAEDLFKKGGYDMALKRFDEIAARHPKEEVGVKALGGSVRCLAALGRREELAQRLQEIKARLGVLPAEEQSQWQEWLKAAIPQAPPDRDADAPKRP